MKFFINKFTKSLLTKISISNKIFNIRYFSQYYKIDDNIFGLNEQQKEVSKVIIELNRIYFSWFIITLNFIFTNILNNIDLNLNRYLNKWTSIFFHLPQSIMIWINWFKLIWILIKKKHIIFFFIFYSYDN